MMTTKTSKIPIIILNTFSEVLYVNIQIAHTSMMMEPKIIARKFIILGKNCTASKYKIENPRATNMQRTIVSRDL